MNRQQVSTSTWTGGYLFFFGAAKARHVLFKDQQFLYALAMPIYEYQCRKCGHHFEKLVRLNETPACPECNDPAPERLFSTSAAVSTGKSRDRAFGKARARATAVKREKDHADAEYIRKEREEHREHD